MLQANLFTTHAGVFAGLRVTCDTCDRTYGTWEPLENPTPMEPSEVYQIAKHFLVTECFNFGPHGEPTCSECFIGIPVQLKNREWFTEAMAS